MDIQAAIPLLALKTAARLLNECDHRSLANNLDRRRLLEEKRPRGNIIGRTQFHKIPVLC